MVVEAGSRSLENAGLANEEVMALSEWRDLLRGGVPARLFISARRAEVFSDGGGKLTGPPTRGARPVRERPVGKDIKRAGCCAWRRCWSSSAVRSGRSGGQRA